MSSIAPSNAWVSVAELLLVELTVVSSTSL